MNGQVKVSLGQIRSIKVNISGEVVTPGTYTLPSLATLFNAIYSAGGVNGIGSLRHIQVFRNSKQIADLDVYDYLINGKYETNIRLEDNDMIIVPPYDNHVTIGGKIKRERIYDMKDGETLARLIDFGGGFTGDAYSDNVTVHRKSGRMLTILTVDKADFGTFELLDGDSVSIGKVLPMYANMVAIEGAVWRPGEYEFSEKIATLSQLIAKAEGLKGSEFASRGQITRVDMANNYTVIPFDVRRSSADDGHRAAKPGSGLHSEYLRFAGRIYGYGEGRGQQPAYVYFPQGDDRGRRRPDLRRFAGIGLAGQDRGGPPDQGSPNRLPIRLKSRKIILSRYRKI